MCRPLCLCPILDVPQWTANNCFKAPYVLKNSWVVGSAPGDTTFEFIVVSWVAAGIIPILSMGNSGPACNAAGARGEEDSTQTISVGTREISIGLAYFSSKKARAREVKSSPKSRLQGTRSYRREARLWQLYTSQVFWPSC